MQFFARTPRPAPQPRVHRTGSRNRQLLLLVLMLAGAHGCAPRRDPVDVPDPVTDQRILRELEARLASEPAVDAERIRVGVEAARVRLYGSVDGIGAWNCALRNAWLVPGVEGVADFLLIERGPPEVTCLAVRG
jgi:hypothetical protein